MRRRKKQRKNKLRESGTERGERYRTKVGKSLREEREVRKREREN